MLGKNVTIIGGSGGMGKVFGKLFKKYGFKITLHSRKLDNLRKVANELGVFYENSLENSVKNADIIMISIPISSTPNMIQKIAPLLKKNVLLFDISSLKKVVVKTMENVIKSYPLNCLSLHPMFGPGIEDMKNYVMIVLRVGGTQDYNALTNELLNIFKLEGLITTETTPEIHDKQIALTLGVPHMLNILFLNLLKRSKETLTELTKYTGTTFLLQKIFAESIIQREMEMFGEIQMENREFHKVLELLENLIKEYKAIIQSRNKPKFNNIFTEALYYSKKDKYFEDSYKYFYEFLNILKKEKTE